MANTEETKGKDGTIVLNPGRHEQYFNEIMLKLTSASVILFRDMHISVNSCSASKLGTPTMLFWSFSNLVRTSSARSNLSQRKQSNIISPSISPVHLQWRKWKRQSQWDSTIATILYFTLMIVLSCKYCENQRRNNNIITVKKIMLPF